MDRTKEKDAETRGAITPEAWAAATPQEQEQYRLGAVCADILIERTRQHDHLKTGRIRFDCADPRENLDRKHRVLSEEVGEFAQAIDAVERAFDLGTQQFIDALRDARGELIQIAAVAAAITTGIDRAIEELEAA